MIYDILEIFKKEYEKKGDKLVLGSYNLKEGLYVKINKNYEIEYFIVKNKNKKLSYLVLKKVDSIRRKLGQKRENF